MLRTDPDCQLDTICIPSLVESDVVDPCLLPVTYVLTVFAVSLILTRQSRVLPTRIYLSMRKVDNQAGLRLMRFSVA